jgi:predicted nicotinamide N-methyase
LKRERFPTRHGNRFWSSSWVLMDYLDRLGLPEDCRVMDVGCGWGLAGIYCARRYGSRVTAVDADPDVFPFLRLHAEANRVSIATLRSDFARITAATLGEIDYLIGADICFWDSLVRPVQNLILRALRAGVRGVLIADPGRSPFEAVGTSVLSRREGEMLSWTTRRPRTIHGRILRVGDGPARRAARG